MCVATCECTCVWCVGCVYSCVCGVHVGGAVYADVCMFVAAYVCMYVCGVHSVGVVCVGVCNCMHVLCVYVVWGLCV